MKTKSWLLYLVALGAAFGGMGGTITNSVPITPHLTFSVSGEKFVDGKKYILPQTQFKSDELIYSSLVAAPELLATGTNSIYYRAFPFNQTFSFTLFDGLGETVEKTELGLANSKTPTPPKQRSDRNKFKPQSVTHELRKLFRPEEMFMIKTNGVHELEVRMRLCMAMTNEVLDFVAMTNGHKFGFASSFGVITSPPVRVRVIKD